MLYKCTVHSCTNDNFVCVKRVENRIWLMWEAQLNELIENTLTTVVEVYDRLAQIIADSASSVAHSMHATLYGLYSSSIA